MRNDYHERLESRRETYERLSEKNASEATARFNSHNLETLRGMGGEPIKIGHHSEKRHRRLIERADNDMRKGSEAYDKSKHYAEKATTVGTGGISRDDPDAVEKVREKLAARKHDHERMKAVNAAYRKYAKSGDEKALAGLTHEETAAVRNFDPETRYSWERKPFPSYTLSNNNAEIKRLERRLKELESMPAVDADGELLAVHPDGPEHGKVETRPDLGRVAITFPGKPSEEIRRDLKSFGFRWSRREMAWLRHLNAAGRNTATSLAKDWGWKEA